MNRDIGTGPFSVFRGVMAGLAISLAGGCGGDDDGGAGDGDGDAASIDAAPGGDASGDRTTEFVADHAGTILLTEGFGGFSTYGAFLADGVDVPPARLLASAGECEIWTHPVEPADCDPACSNAYCVADDRCEPYPAPRSAGDITVTGLLEPVRFVAGEFGYRADPKFPPEDLWAAGATLTATASGDEAPGFTLEVTGVADLEADLDLEFDHTLILEDGVDEVIRWTPEESGRIQLGLLIGHHGAPYEAMLVCESEDDGELVVPGALVTQLPEQSSGLEQHSSWIARFDRDVVETDAGPVELFLSNRVIIPQLQRR